MKHLERAAYFQPLLYFKPEAVGAHNRGATRRRLTEAVQQLTRRPGNSFQSRFASRLRSAAANPMQLIPAADN